MPDLRTRAAHIARVLFSIDLRTLALVRIGLATMLLVDLADRGRHLVEFYTDDGFLPRAALAEIDPTLVSLHLLGGSVGFQSALFALAALCALALAVGFKTRVAAVASWVLLISLHNRNYLLNGGGDLELQRVLFWCLFLPLGARASVDARGGGAPAPQRVCSLASAAVMLQVAYVYLFAGLAKSGPAWNSEYTAIYQTLGNELLVTPLGIWLRDFEGLLAFMTPLVLWFERLCFLGFFSPIRTAQVRLAMIAATWLFHAGLGSMIELGTFPFISAICVLVFLPGSFWDWLESLRPREPETGAPAPSDPPGDVAAAAPPSRAARAVVGLALLYTTVLLSVDVTDRLDVPKNLRRLGQSLQLNQSWALFSPDPSSYDVQRVVRGRLEDGSLVDHLLDSERDEQWARIAALHHDSHFKVFLKNFPGPRFRPHVALYGRWLCAQWNREGVRHQSGLGRLRVVRWLAISKEIQPGGRRGPPISEVIMTHPCSQG